MQMDPAAVNKKVDQERDAVVEQARRSHYGVEQEDSD